MGFQNGIRYFTVLSLFHHSCNGFWVEFFTFFLVFFKIEILRLLSSFIIKIIIIIVLVILSLGLKISRVHLLLHPFHLLGSATKGCSITKTSFIFIISTIRLIGIIIIIVTSLSSKCTCRFFNFFILCSTVAVSKSKEIVISFLKVRLRGFSVFVLLVMVFSSVFRNHGISCRFTFFDG